VTFVVSPRLDQRVGLELTVASEAFQYTGGFKFRPALQIAAHSPAGHLIGASSVRAIPGGRGHASQPDRGAGWPALGPLKTAIVQDQRCMTTWVVRKGA
jgi:hypothetical protein